MKTAILNLVVYSLLNLSLELKGLNYHYHHAKLWNNEGGFSILFVKDTVN